MQAVLNSSPAAERLHLASGRDYMMRSEKRPDPIRRASTPGKKPPRRRRKRAGFFYMLLMTLLLLILWPLGLLMLWQRKVRWGVLTKLLTSIITLAACIILIGFALTVNTGNAQYTAAQDSINSFLDSAADTLVNFGDIVSEYAFEMADDMENVADALWGRGKVYLANGIDAGIALTQQAENGMLDLVEKLQSTPEPTAEVLETAEATPLTDDSEAPQTTPASSQTDTPTPDTSAKADASPSTQSDEDRATTAAPDNTTEAIVPVYELNDATETTAVAADGEESDAAATVQLTTEPTAEPTPQIVAPAATLKPASQATVYHSMDGKWYHSFNRCSGMTGGGAYTLEECAADYKQCRACSAPDAALIGQDCMWMDARSICHTSDECSAFEGKYTLILRDEALDQGLTGCEKCGGNEYLIPGSIIETALTGTDVPTVDASAE